LEFAQLGLQLAQFLFIFLGIELTLGFVFLGHGISRIDWTGVIRDAWGFLIPGV
jgi:hypothetical protein